MRRAKWIAVAGIGLTLTACASRRFNQERPAEGSLESLKGQVKKDKFGRPVVDRFYLANLYSTEAIKGGTALIGDALVYGIACFDEPLDDGQLINVPDKPMTDRDAHIVFKEIPLKSRTYVHEFSPFFAPKDGGGEQTAVEEKNVPRIEDLRRSGLCRVIYGTEKLAWGEGKLKPVGNRDLLEKQILEKLSSTAGTCADFATHSLISLGMAVSGAAAVLPTFIPTVLGTGTVLGVFKGALGCMPAISSFKRESATTRQKVAESVFNESWNTAAEVAIKAIKADAALSSRLDEAMKSKDYLTAAALFNPEFVKAFNSSINGDMHRKGGWFNIATTLTADDFFTYILQLESAVGLEFVNAMPK